MTFDFQASDNGEGGDHGPKTYDSIGELLTHRLNIVVTRSADWSAEGVVVAHSLRRRWIRPMRPPSVVMLILMR